MMKMKSLLFSLMLLSVPVSAIATQVITFVVKSRPAADMIDVVRPLLGDNGSVSAFHDKLIVRGSQAQITSVGKLLKQLDRPARRLLIEVRRSGQFADQRRDVGYGAATDNVRLGRAPSREGARLHYREAQTSANIDGVHRIQALDGHPALIRTGTSIPIYRAHQHVVGNQIVQGFDVSYRDATSGFYAVPRVHGDQVTVEIYQQQQRHAGNGRFDSQQASTVLHGALGDWLTLGSVANSGGDKHDAFGRHVQTRSSHDQRIELRVVAID